MGRGMTISADAVSRRSAAALSGADPEREMVRRALPLGPPAIALALGIGWMAAGPGVGWSAALGIAVVWLNFIANGLSLARAARISLVTVFAVGLGGFVV